MTAMRRIVALSATMALILVPASAHANSLYFEFSPDFGLSLLVASQVQPVEQVFLPLNDHVSAFDVWASNDNTAGNVTFELYSPNDILLSSVTKPIPATPDSPTGTRFGVSLPAQVSTIANQAYYIRAITAVPTFRLYYATQFQILAHNAEPQAIYTGGLARIGGEDREFAFKSALYETNESTAPVITNVDADIISVSQAVLSFNASEPVDAQVSYGPQGQAADGTVAYTGGYTSCAAGIQFCNVTLPILHPGTSHDFTLTVRDVWGNTAFVTGTFTSLGTSIAPSPTPTPNPTATPAPTPDIVPPTISNARAAVVTHDKVTIAWTTDEAANSLVVISFGLDDITAGGNSDSTLELEHAITIPNLGAQTPYTAEITSADAVGNKSETTVFFTTTKAPLATPGPTPSQSASPTPTVSVGPSSDGGGQQAQWSPPDGGPPAGGYRVDIIGTDGNLIESIYTNDTSANVGALPDDAQIIVYADNGDGLFEKVASPTTHKKDKPLLEQLILNLPYILGGLGVLVIALALLWRKFRPVRPVEHPESMQSAPTIGGSFSSEA